MKPYYEEDGITIFHGDCREVLPGLGRCSVITDPPYGYSYASDHVCDTTTAEWMQQTIRNDDDLSIRDFICAWAADVPWAIFGSWKMPKPADTRAVLIWDKGPASGMGDLQFPWKGSWEEIYIGGKGWHGYRDEGVLKGHWIVTRASMGRVHPNEKPVSLLSHLIQKLPAHDCVIDPCAGSGATLVAAKNLGRKAIGIELEEKYCEIAAKRLSQRVLEFA
jgi:site-specific DNA-methyltransferase (adenine-specific)